MVLPDGSTGDQCWAGCNVLTPQVQSCTRPPSFFNLPHLHGAEDEWICMWQGWIPALSLGFVIPRFTSGLLSCGKTQCKHAEVEQTIYRADPRKGINYWAPPGGVLIVERVCVKINNEGLKCEGENGGRWIRWRVEGKVEVGAWSWLLGENNSVQHVFRFIFQRWHLACVDY